jgi:hypothetical protein
MLDDSPVAPPQVAAAASSFVAELPAWAAAQFGASDESAAAAYHGRFGPQFGTTNERTAAALDTVAHPLHPVVDHLRGEVRDLRARLARADEERKAAVVAAKAEAFLHFVRVLRSEGVAGVERLKSTYGGDAAAAMLRHGGGTMMVGGGAQRSTAQFAVPRVADDVLTREELHSGLRKALRNL